MHDRINEPLPPSERRTGPVGPTGPRTPAGKAKSSQNSLKHGCRSPKTVLPHEDPAEFEATVQGWLTHYQPDTQPAITLVENLARAHWALKRNEKRLEDIEWELPANAYDWTDEHHKLYSTTNRYKTTAERSFIRYFKEVEAHYHRIHRDDQARQLAFAKLASIEFKRLDKADAAALEQIRVEQVVEIEVEDGECITTCYPSNEELIEAVAERPAPPLYIARLMLFPNGFVPAEYAWAQPVQIQEGEAPRKTQRMLWQHWLDLIEREDSTDTGHISPV
jgi:hypothetical protein